MKSARFYLTKAFSVAREQGVTGLLASIAGKAASLLVEVENRLGGYAARHWRFADQETPERGQGQAGAGVGPPLEPAEIWFDVGAHLGELTFAWARRNPESVVYAFEPNIKAASKVIGRLPNFVVIPMAVSASNGFQTFYENAYEESSSLLPVDPEVREMWVKGDRLEVVNSYPVPCIRLDTFMEIMKIPRVDFLKIDAQGYDYEVVRSCGERLKDVQRIQLEVTVTGKQFYRGAKGKPEILELLSSNGFVLREEKVQTYGMEENLIFVREKDPER